MAPMSTGRNAVALLVLAGALLVAVAPGLAVAASGATKAAPSNFKVAVNGRTLTSAELAAGADNYMSTKTGRTQVAVRWRNDLSGSGYYVLIVDSAGGTKHRCTTGTSCAAVGGKPLAVGNEVSWSIQIRRTAGNKLASEKVVCLIGKA